MKIITYLVVILLIVGFFYNAIVANYVEAFGFIALLVGLLAFLYHKTK